MKTLAIPMFTALLLATTVALLGQAPATQKLASGTYVVYAQSPQIWRVKVDPKTMGNVMISGHFSVTQGTPKTVDVFVFDEENYKKWTEDNANAQAAAKPLGSVIRAGEGNISAPLTTAGYDYLVISDRREYEGSKTVVADISLQYDKH